MDLITNEAAVNGRSVELGMVAVLENWLRGELGRLGRDRSWLTEAKVEVAYNLLASDSFMNTHPGFWTSQARVAELTARARVTTADGSAGASFENVQTAAKDA